MKYTEYLVDLSVHKQDYEKYTKELLSINTTSSKTNTLDDAAKIKLENK